MTRPDYGSRAARLSTSRQHWAKLRAILTQPSPRASPSTRTTTPEEARGARRTCMYVERRGRPRTWHFELSGPAARRELSKYGEANWPSTRVDRVYVTGV